LQFEAVVERLEPGKLKGQKIAIARSRNAEIVFDVIEGLIDLRSGDNIVIEITPIKPENLDPYIFCGHGYLAAKKDDAELLSLWGILFLFKPPIGLQDNVKYYLCIKKVS